MTIGTISIVVGVVLMILLKLFFKEDGQAEENGEVYGVDHNELFKEDLEYDASWGVLSSNTHYSEED
jgi:hypothetical protein